MRRLLPLFIVVALATAHSPARAQPTDDSDDDPGATYFYDGGAVPFIYGSLAVAGIFHFLVPLPDEPRLFSADEGGAIGGDDTVPEAAVAGYAIAVGGIVGLVPSEGRWYHFKGFLESTATTLAVTEAAKATFGRHRPHWQPGDDDKDTRRSFFSGHSSLTFSTTTYLGLYLHQHVFDRWRDPGEHYAWWELGPHLLLAGGAAAVAWTRVEDKRHHKSDVITGAAVGTVSSLVFYAWQQSRLRGRGESSNLTLGPGPGRAGVSLRLEF